MDVKLKRIVVQ